MFVTVRYGEGRSKIFNAHCKNEVLLENIKQNCDCADHEVVEVSDERGVVKNLRNFPTEYGSDFLKSRETLVLLAVQNESIPGSDKPVFTPLLTSLRNDTAFNDSLNGDRDLDDLPDSERSHSRLQLLSEPEDDVLNRSFRGKGKAGGGGVSINNNNSSSSSNSHSLAPVKKSILRKNSKNSTRK